MHELSDSSAAHISDQRMLTLVFGQAHRWVDIKYECKRVKL